MDLDDQARIQQVVDRVGSDDLVVLLGSPNPESAELYAATVTLGDPTFAGPLAGIPLGLPVYHVLEPEAAGRLSADTYAQHLAMAALTLEVEPILSTVPEVAAQGLGLYQAEHTVGYVVSGHPHDESQTAPNMLENLACKTSAAEAAKMCLAGFDPLRVTMLSTPARKPSVIAINVEVGIWPKRSRRRVAASTPPGRI